jgi:hypothetical protein
MKFAGFVETGNHTWNCDPRVGRSEGLDTNPQGAAADFYKVKVSSLQAAIDGSFVYSGNGGRFLRRHQFYFATALLAPAVRWGRAPKDRQHATGLHRNFRSPSAHGAARQRTGRVVCAPSIQAALN